MPPLSARLVALAGLAAFLAAADPVRNGLHRARGGDIVITHALPIKGDAMLVAVDHSSHDLATAKFDAPSEMRETEVANLVSHVLGAQPVTAEVPKQAQAFPGSTMFHKPRANLMVAIPGVGSASLSDQGLSQLQSLTDTHRSFTITNTFEPRHDLSQFTTLVTGELPSAHGIVGSQWTGPSGAKATAYDESERGSHAAVPTIADMVAHSYDAPLVVSLSADRQFAAAGSVHAYEGSSAEYLSLDAATRGLQSSSPNSALRLSNIDLPALLQDQDTHSLLSRFTAASGSITITSTTATVSTGDTTATFDLTSTADYNFLAELAAVNHLLKQLKTDTMAAKVHDSSPDIYTITLVGYKALAAAHGDADARTRVAAKMLDAAVPQLLHEFSRVYNADMAAELVLMGSQNDVNDPEVFQAVHEVTDGKLRKGVDATSTFPNLYVEEKLTHDEVQELCSHVNQAVATHGLKAHCVSEYTRPIFLQEKAVLMQKDDSSSDDAPSLAQVTQYQINLWVCLLLLFCLFFSIMPLVYMDYTSGTFSSFLYAKKYI